MARSRIFAAAGFALTLLGVSCAREHLKDLEFLLNAQVNYVTVDARFCTAPRVPGKQKIKYLFIVDHSQSNQPGFPNPMTPMDVTATDPAGSRRYGPLVQFVRNLIPDPNNQTYFDLIDFNDKGYQPKNITGFEGDPTVFLGNVIPDWVSRGTANAPSPDDHGFTNYQSALRLAQQVILADAQGESASTARPIVTSSYKVVFVSDGVPTVVAAGGAATIVTQDFSKDLLPVINDIVSLKNDPVLGPYISAIELDTAYYFTTQEVIAAETLLQQMATAGNGVYFQFGAGKDIAYQDFAPPSRNLKASLAEVWVENQNVIWWPDGTLRLSSGGSGMPDDLKLAAGGNPLKRDSDGNGVGDLVEFKMKGRFCGDATCSRKGADPYAVCDGLTPVLMSDGSTTFPFSSGNGFNDCESFILGSDLNTFSTNQTFVRDSTAFKNGLPFLPGSDGTLADPFGDGLTNYAKLKLGLPTTVSKAKLLDFQTRKISLVHEDSNPVTDTDCYHMTVEKVAIIGNDNHIEFHVIQNSAVLDDKPVLKTAVRTVAGQQSPITFVPEDFQ